MTKTIPVANKWMVWGLFNLTIVALYGMLMRYKIAFDFPLLDQKNLLHAHSHFAFSGWVSHMLYSALVLCIEKHLSSFQRKKYRWLLLANLICSLGMLVAFTWQGYKAVSISFSTLSIVVSVLFTFNFIKDSKGLQAVNALRPWAVAGLLFNVASAAGPLFLAYIMVSKNIDHRSYLGSIYYYLHFQYSGWFFFCSMGLLASKLSVNFAGLKTYFYVFVLTAIPTFFLSVLWAKLPVWLYVIVVICSIAQLIAWISFAIKLNILFKQQKSFCPRWIVYFFYVAGFALSLKFLLQAISVVPSLSQLVFGIRPIVIAYLHLILLGVYSIFLIAYSFSEGLLRFSKMAGYAAMAFLAGVFINELLLATQGFAAFFYVPVPYVNEMLFGAAVLLFCTALCLFVSQVKNSNSAKL